ncbi:hypothetical protein L6452_32756 [Arctium lappa]|uniref:Uncharacterized protein n=1 Tax=Arctium lappa TaxID=4217 RepID=A0ACB8Z5E7_ARCLA|nr:hypothetical protein L6452_32756 [Arctium lappa]
MSLKIRSLILIPINCGSKFRDFILIVYSYIYIYASVSFNPLFLPSRLFNLLFCSYTNNFSIQKDSNLPRFSKAGNCSYLQKVSKRSFVCLNY